MTTCHPDIKEKMETNPWVSSGDADGLQIRPRIRHCLPLASDSRAGFQSGRRRFDWLPRGFIKWDMRDEIDTGDMLFYSFMWRFSRVATCSGPVCECYTIKPILISYKIRNSILKWRLQVTSLFNLWVNPLSTQVLFRLAFDLVGII